MRIAGLDIPHEIYVVSIPHKTISNLVRWTAATLKEVSVASL